MWTEEHRRIYRREGNGYPAMTKPKATISSSTGGITAPSRHMSVTGG
jgi:hypothetical protein